MKTTIAAVGLLLITAWYASGVAQAENWPCFRGPTRQGISHETMVPTRWSPTEGIVWRQSIPGEGVSSPIVFGSRVFLTAATDGGASLRLLVLDGSDGHVLWDKEILRQRPGHKSRQNSYATSTPATDGERVYVAACDGRIVAVAMTGEVAWVNDDLEYYSEHGLAVSPVLYDDLVIMPFDASSPGPDKKVGWQVPWDKAVILAVDRNTGQTQWQGRRGSSRIAHVVPIVVTIDGCDQLVSGAGDVVQGFDLKTGDRRWTVSSPGEGVVPSIVGDESLIFATSGFGESAIRAVRPDGQGDVTKTHTAWQSSDDVPKVPSMLYVEPYLYLITESGIVKCLQGTTGQVIWKDRLGGKFSASPIWADGKIYFLSEKGTTTIIQDGPEFRVLAENDLSEACYASPAISEGLLFIRSERSLFCIGQAR
ncbi:MAG: PQQ-binding-like beta-propeller repeat protein [Sedimentisphaerales bacterium]|mgnify:CR=1 FL=1|jgi:outer membrane protein assembly factor BamB|nr:PQQ-binding-like beta-propeller repeat protein [Sedimentisphaerales bacterium]HNY79509.1 PQQ-binding-like beta-propeller repeat protein [Sedimentisphaerales bacterium]HOC62359.1 PQQ-binding-like beta-propeller repeat protein [Sedimentisphaerales bacterium]HOH65491.1 PQQ-binding-like beta-propeller repeat protein [Sedimentisphaerales bacterium]HQA92061.1 PQQ-binding-like beta-propeller repeat protein [Sedimentisphaerales bacterium]